MNPCANCGAIPRPTDKFCNTCGTPVVASSPAAPYPAAAAWGAPPPPPRCQMGHEVPPGQNYCPQGHPIALEQVQFAANPSPYGSGAPAGYAAPPPQGGVKYAQAGSSPPAAPSGYSSSPSSSYAAAAYPPPPAYPPPQAYAPPPPPPPPPAYAPPPPQYAAPPQQYAPPAPAPPPQQYAPPPPAPPPPYAPPPPAPPPPPADAKAATLNAPIVPSALAGFLVSFDSNPSGDFWPLNGGRHTVGRANSGEQVDIPLADATISSRHAVLEVDAIASTIQVEDTGSTNGTFVNDEHVGFSGRRELKDGDRLRLGGFNTLVKVIARG